MTNGEDCIEKDTRCDQQNKEKCKNFEVWNCCESCMYCVLCTYAYVWCVCTCVCTCVLFTCATIMILVFVPLIQWSVISLMKPCVRTGRSVLEITMCVMVMRTVKTNQMKQTVLVRDAHTPTDIHVRQC